MKPRESVTCPYCLEQGIKVEATIDKVFKPLKENTTRYGCPNRHFFALPTEPEREVS